MILAVLFVAVAVAALWRLQPLHPVQLWIVPWAVSVSLFALDALPYRSLAPATQLFIGAGSAVFVVGALAGEATARRIAAGRLPRQRPDETSATAIGAVIALALTAVLLSAFLVQAIGGHGLRDTLVSSPSVRAGIRDGEFSITIKFVYAALAAVALTSVLAARAPAQRTRLAWAAAAAGAAATTYFSTGRSNMAAALLVGAAAAALSATRRLSRRALLGGLVGATAVVLAIFIAGGNLIGKSFENNSELQALPSVFVRHDSLSQLGLPYQYGTASLAALDIQIDDTPTWGSAHGCAVLSEQCRILAKAGLDLEGVPRIRPFTASPLPWNTYTGLDAPLLDGGLVLALPILALAAIALGALWHAARLGWTPAVIAYALLVPALLTGYSQFNFTAPHLLGAILIALASVGAGRVLGRVRSQPSAPGTKRFAGNSLG